MDYSKKKRTHVPSTSNSNYYKVRVKEASEDFKCPVCKHTALLIKGEVVVCDACGYTPDL